MSTEDLPALTAKRWQGCTDVYDFLDQIRLRPGMWLPGGSLQHLQSRLIGYRVALAVHSIDEPWAFWPEDDFNRWLREHRGIDSSLTWAAEIERNTPDGDWEEAWYKLNNNPNCPPGPILCEHKSTGFSPVGSRPDGGEVGAIRSERLPGQPASGRTDRRTYDRPTVTWRSRRPVMLPPA
ncbi:hypothetical protein ACGF3K_34030 [Streptomyces sp. NPDC047980]|uniref:hypothetical protein n=1 Tax=Streptomyces sp. NPDC047980 TaxID=3365494 RepID=UPI00371A5D82